MYVRGRYICGGTYKNPGLVRRLGNRSEVLGSRDVFMCVGSELNVALLQ